MRDVLTDIIRWRAQGEQIALATVVHTIGSSPRQVGAKMAVSASDKIAGSVSAGCVEGAVFEQCQVTLQTGQPQLLHVGVADEEAWEVGLACGGQIDVFVESLTGDTTRLMQFEQLQQALQNDHPAVQATRIAPANHPTLGQRLLLLPPGEQLGHIGSAALDQQIGADAQQLLADGLTGLRTYLTPDGNASVLIESFPPTPTLYIVGAVHIAIELVHLARPLGFRTVVIDARAAFATPERFQVADELIIGWPDEILPARLNSASYVVVLAHDPKLDDPALQSALPSAARYVGALGSRHTNARRRDRLRAAGLTEAHLQRLHGPVGLSIGARSPAEIAVSILAEIIQEQRQAHNRS